MTPSYQILQMFITTKSPSFLFCVGSPVLKKQAPRTMSTLHEDTNVEEAEAIIEATSHGKVPEDKCQPAAPQRPSALLDKSQLQQQQEVSRLVLL